MEVFLALIIGMIIAAFTVLVAYLFDWIQKLKFRNHLPLVCGLFFVAILLLLNPQQQPGQGWLYALKAWSHYILLPFFIFAPLPYIGKWTDTVFSKTSVFLGAFLTVNYYFMFLTYGDYYFEQFWQVDGLFWTAGALVPASLIFVGIYFSQKFLSRISGSNPTDTSIENVRKSPISWIAPVVFLLIFSFPFFMIVSLGNTETCGGFEVYPVDQSQISNKTVIHLTENDFRDFPRMAPFIRDGKTISGGCMSSRYDPNTCIGKGSFRCNEGPQFSRYNDNYLEYNGRYYIITQSYIV